MVDKNNTRLVNEGLVRASEYEVAARQDIHSWWWRVPARLMPLKIVKFKSAKQKGYITCTSRVNNTDVYHLPVDTDITMQAWADELIRQRETGLMRVYGEESTVKCTKYGAGGHCVEWDGIPVDDPYTPGMGSITFDENCNPIGGYNKPGISEARAECLEAKRKEREGEGGAGETIKTTIIAPIVLVGVAIVVLWYFLMGRR